MSFIIGGLAIIMGWLLLLRLIGKLSGAERRRYNRMAKQQLKYNDAYDRMSKRRNGRGNTLRPAPQAVPPPSVPASWYPDPNNGKIQRYWDGTRWTEHTAPLA
jgi:hypothetical protein